MRFRTISDKQCQVFGVAEISFSDDAGYGSPSHMPDALMMIIACLLSFNFLEPSTLPTRKAAHPKRIFIAVTSCHKSWASRLGMTDKFPSHARLTGRPQHRDAAVFPAQVSSFRAVHKLSVACGLTENAGMMILLLCLSVFARTSLSRPVHRGRPLLVNAPPYVDSDLQIIHHVLNRKSGRATIHRRRARCRFW